MPLRMKKRKCVDCGTTENVVEEPCPFAEEIYDDDTPVCLCKECRHEKALDI